MKTKIPLCFYPTQIVFIDDNSDFLRSVSLALSADFEIKTFSDCDAALRFINKDCKEKEGTQESSLKPEGESDAWVKRVLENGPSQHAIAESHREISVVIVDFSMPQMNGIEFCRSIKNTSVKRILLTGYATPSDAVQAFNENIINYYIRKNDEDMLTELKKSIESLQQCYFSEISQKLKSDAIDSATPFFSDPLLSAHFHELCKSLQIQEYFYKTSPSRFLLTSDKGDKYYWLVYSEQDIQEHLAILKEESAPEGIIKRLEEKTQVPFFTTEDGFYDACIVNVETQLHPATLINGKTTYLTCLLPYAEKSQSTNLIHSTQQLH